jgi:hypothetical protein
MMQHCSVRLKLVAAVAEKSEKANRARYLIAWRELAGVDETETLGRVGNKVETA